MKIIIDRDSVCMGDDFGHQKAIECSEDETIESLMNKLLQTDFFPVEDLRYMANKWELKINSNKVLTFFPNNNKIKYHIDKNTPISSIENNKLFFSYISNSCTHLIILWKFICLIYTKLKQRKWTHIVAPLYFHFYILLALVLYYDTKYPSEEKFSACFGFILYSLYFLPKLALFSIIFAILLNVVALKRKNINIIKNKFILNNKIYNIYWLLSIILMLYSFYLLILFTFSPLFE